MAISFIVIIIMLAIGLNILLIFASSMENDKGFLKSDLHSKVIYRYYPNTSLTFLLLITTSIIIYSIIRTIIVRVFAQELTSYYDFGVVIVLITPIITGKVNILVGESDISGPSKFGYFSGKREIIEISQIEVISENTGILRMIIPLRVITSFTGKKIFIFGSKKRKIEELLKHIQK